MRGEKYGTSEIEDRSSDAHRRSSEFILQQQTWLVCSGAGGNSNQCRSKNGAKTFCLINKFLQTCRHWISVSDRDKRLASPAFKKSLSNVRHDCLSAQKTARQTHLGHNLAEKKGDVRRGRRLFVVSCPVSVSRNHSRVGRKLQADDGLETRCYIQQVSHL